MTTFHELGCVMAMGAATGCRCGMPRYTVTERLPTVRPDDSWVQTYTGRRYWPHDPSPDDVDIEDIAHALSNLCRYTGHCSRFYSLAEHSVHVSNLTGDMDGLLHDAREAYVNDLATPTKRYLPDYKAMEDRNAAAVAKHFGIAHPTPRDVKTADQLVYWAERRQLMLRHPAHTQPPDVPDILLPPLGLAPVAAKALFLARYSALLATR